ncbi:glycine cleavage system protein H [Microbulbifer flavimaris]|uniref:Glycine cleavage system H protein n=1 Tax=Microbulbifer flavimaris TaxID=1781068 RepID=A0ABX4I2D2_9GAMM|nr:glycine cleavage system protein GcvH [Microbulbifer sp. ZGT114]KUJ84497.1 glycine cleavage system protein H [Microbulbifer sp. ZGT114]PCO06584.1 glycine cleavage system protein H [Microbulbifer flavimaris]
MSIEIMKNVRFSDSHEWFAAEGDVVTVGITDYAQSQLGDVVYVELPEEGAELTAGDEVAVIESVKAAGDISIPFDATVLAVNDALEGDPELVNRDPMGEGWFMRVRLAKEGDLETLLNAGAYADLVGG